MQGVGCGGLWGRQRPGLLVRFWGYGRCASRPAGSSNITALGWCWCPVYSGQCLVLKVQAAVGVPGVGGAWTSSGQARCCCCVAQVCVAPMARVGWVW